MDPRRPGARGWTGAAGGPRHIAEPLGAGETDVEEATLLVLIAARVGDDPLLGADDDRRLDRQAFAHTHSQEPHAAGLSARVVLGERLDLAEEAGEIDVGLDGVVDNAEQVDELVGYWCRRVRTGERQYEPLAPPLGNILFLGHRVGVEPRHGAVYEVVCPPRRGAGHPVEIVRVSDEQRLGERCARLDRAVVNGPAERRADVRLEDGQPRPGERVLPVDHQPGQQQHDPIGGLADDVVDPRWIIHVDAAAVELGLDGAAELAVEVAAAHHEDVGRRETLALDEVLD